MPITIQITEPWTPEDVDRAMRTLSRLAAPPDVAPVAPSKNGATDDGDGRTAAAVYQRGGGGGLSRQLLEVLPAGRDDAETPEELGRRMRPHRTKAEVRAAIRNVRRIEASLRKEGAVMRGVLLADSEAYEKDGASRYYVTAADRAAIDALAKGRAGR
ncbi:MAG: hypothetical protein U1E65_03615 [Myxococcota bacterium]